MKIRDVIAAVAMMASGTSAFAGDWTGAYAGISVGGAGSSDTWTTSQGGFQYANMNNRSAVGGVQAGYNWQKGSFVTGVEADYLFGSLKGNQTCLTVLSCSDKISGLGSLRGRVGWAASESALIYLTGGVGVASTRQSISTAANPAAGSFSSQRTSAVAVLGAGAEFKIAEHWTLRGEYMYYNFGHYSAAVSDLGIATDLKVSASALKVGLNYKF